MNSKPLQKSHSNNGKAIFCMALLTIQFGCQPMLTRTFTPSSICKSTVILVQETVKFTLAMSMLFMNGQFKTAVKGWSVSSWIQVAVLPAGLYTIQNTAALMAYQNLDGVTFNVLNQTKTLSAAVCCYLLLGKRQSKIQILSLVILFISALIVQNLIPLTFLNTKIEEKTKNEELDSELSTNITQGVFPVLLASFISGLAGAISQKNLQNEGRNPFLFSSELCVASIIALLCSMIVSSDGEKIRQNGFFHNWTSQTLIPVFTNAVGGIIVGLVTKYAGSVRKGFALIFGMVLTGVVQSVKDGVPLSSSQIVGGFLAACSLWLHTTNPYKVIKREKQD